MEEIIAKIIVLIFCGLGIYSIIKNIKNAESFIEKILILLSLFIYFIPATIYILDSYDIPTKLRIFNKVDIERWNNFLVPYINTIVGNVVSGVVLLLITYWQIRKQVESNNEDKRIQNAPVMKYDITNEYIDDSEQFYLFNGIDKNTHPCNIFLKIENIGLNHARHFKIDIHDIGNEKIRTYTIDSNQSIIKKDEKITIDLIIAMEKKENSKIIKLYVFYDDILKNKYKQEVILNISASEEYGYKYRGNKIIINSVEIKDEELIKENGDNDGKNNNKC